MSLLLHLQNHRGKSCSCPSDDWAALTSRATRVAGHLRADSGCEVENQPKSLFIRPKGIGGL